MKLHLVDGTYELFRAFYGAPSATNESGEEIGASRAFLRSLAALLRQPEVTHVGVAFDHVIESFRNQLFAGYKTGDGIDPDLWAQFPLAEQVAEALGLAVWPMVEFEADDALASAAHRFGPSPGLEQVIICSPDKDLTQCVKREQVVCLDRRRELTLDEAAVVKKFGVGPQSIPDYLALVGDSADGIPGLRRWGAKSTAAVLAHYRHIDAIPDDAGAWAVKVRGAGTLARSLREGRREANLYRRLATLRRDVPIAQTLADLEWRGAKRPDLTALCARLNDKPLLNRITRWEA